ncbi:alpha/beta fold hydrolase [Pedobacter roseus]|uniref:Alpha/beta hydrolase n=1 Tax=Pedobacter roseus TaxID=336820 RepID=A0A7G9QGY0_9SPHI|nr:alpha/beta hydrolase [Pedobacter roseus]QNN42605.1 alpha/beta hydrolase [Pedobacter roseus]
MKNFFKTSNPLKSVLVIILMLFTAAQSKGQQTKPAASGYAPVKGTKVYYEVYGEGKPLILLHGAFMTIETNWGQLIPELSKTRKVIAIELQGHGHSPYSDRKLELPTLASDVEAVMNQLKVDSADVVGYSMGGSVAYQLIVQSPKRVNKLVIISSTYKTSGWMPAVTSAFKGMKPEFLANTPMKTAYDAIAPDKTKWNSFLEQMIDFVKVPFDMGDANIAKITSPVLLIAGDNDGLDKTELIKTYQLLGGAVFADMGKMPKSQLAVVPAQGHVSLMMQSKTILGYLDGFLK